MISTQPSTLPLLTRCWLSKSRIHRLTMIATRKMPRYAEAEIAEAWLVDLTGQGIEQYTLPRNGRYLNLRRLEHGDTIVRLRCPLSNYLSTRSSVVSIDIGPTLA